MSQDQSDNRRPIDRLLDIMVALRTPNTGCPWDIEQTFDSIAPYTIEEAYEVADALERGNLHDFREELGDLLFQVVFQSQIAEEQGLFTFEDVAKSIGTKLIRRHPHVFGTPDGRSSEEQTKAWEALKAKERAEKALKGVLDDVPVGLPALSRAVKLTKRAARVGFDWGSTREVFDKAREEIAELEAEIDAQNLEKIEDEFGDLMFVMANLARKLDIDPEKALRGTNAKFVRRFSHIEAALKARGKRPEDSDLAEMDALWDEAKVLEKLGR